jgi:membrane associated rhomboid family serine protease
MWNNKVQLDRPQLTICMAHAPRMLDKYKQTCRILLIAFLQQLWLHKNASVLYYTYFAYRVTYLYCSTSTWPFTLISSIGKQSITQKRKQSTTQDNDFFSWLAPVSAYVSHLCQWLRVWVQENSCDTMMYCSTRHPPLSLTQIVSN